MNLFSQLAAEPTHEELFPGAVLMRSLALPQDAEFFAAIETILAAAPLHQPVSEHHQAPPVQLELMVLVVTVLDAQRRPGRDGRGYFGGAARGETSWLDS